VSTNQQATPSAAAERTSPVVGLTSLMIDVTS